MPMDLYRFDHLTAFPLLATFTTARNPAFLRITGQGDAVGLAITLDRHAEDPADIDLVFGLPFVAVDGQLERLELDVVGDLTGCRMCLEGTDSGGARLVYALADDARSGRQRCSAQVQAPSGVRGEISEEKVRTVQPPLQLHRLRVTVGPGVQRLDLRLLRLRVTGDARRCPTGIAGEGEGAQLS